MSSRPDLPPAANTINSRAKGARRERELANILTAAGFPAHRGQQYRGGPDSPDIICPSLPWLHWECKGTERLRLWQALQQAQFDSLPAQIALVAHKKNHEPWMVTMALDDFLSTLPLPDPGDLIPDD